MKHLETLIHFDKFIIEGIKKGMHAPDSAFVRKIRSLVIATEDALKTNSHDKKWRSMPISDMAKAAIIYQQNTQKEETKMNLEDLARIKELTEQLEDIRSILDEIAENLSSLNNAGLKVESAAYYIGEATELLNKIEE